eukprot:TRINITY_DN3026_c0_g1_i1.p1 TRINITY_DN3026_c0_g1~~TRINITY_DN3026_c0_g1_i1.p1  ORF type:complete len:1707 (+),score=291.65 TRINITY_DN3026_c0_g1_i1:51-5171(+)
MLWLLCALWGLVASSQQDDLLDFVSGMPLVDGFEGVDFTDPFFGLEKVELDNTGTFTSVQKLSGATILIPGFKIQDGTVRRTVYSQGADVIYVRVLVHWDFRVVNEVTSSVINVGVVAEKAGNLNHGKAEWKGSLVSESGDTNLKDENIFDGILPVATKINRVLESQASKKRADVVQVRVPEINSLTEILMTDATTYEILECGKGTTVALIGLVDKDSDTSPVSALNWRVRLSLPDYTTPCTVRIYSANVANGTIEAILPLSSSELPHSILTKSIGSPLRFGLMDVGLVSVTVIGVSFIEVKSADSVQITVEGIPSNIDLVIEADRPSTMNVLQLASNILAVNFNVSLPTYLKDIVVIATGAESHSSVSLASADLIEYRNGCVTTAEPGNIVYTDPFLNYLQAFSIPSEAITQSCLFFTNGTAGLEIIGSSTSQINIVDIGVSTAPTVSLTGHVAYLVDTIPWGIITVKDRYLNIDSRLTMNLAVSEVMIGSNVLSDSTTLNVTCQDLDSPTWKFGEGLTTLVRWNSLSCNGILTVSPSKFLLQGEGVSAYATFPSGATVNLRAKLGAAATNTALIMSGRDIDVQGSGVLQIQDLPFGDTGVLNLVGDGVVTFKGVGNQYSSTGIKSLYAFYPIPELGDLTFTGVLSAGNFYADLDEGIWNLNREENMITILDTVIELINISAYSTTGLISESVDWKDLKAHFTGTTDLVVKQTGVDMDNFIRSTGGVANATVDFELKTVSINNVENLALDVKNINGSASFDFSLNKALVDVDLLVGTVQCSNVSKLYTVMTRKVTPIGYMDITALINYANAELSFATGVVNINDVRRVIANVTLGSDFAFDAATSASKVAFSIEDQKIRLDRVSAITLAVSSNAYGKLQLKSNNAEPDLYAMDGQLAQVSMNGIMYMTATRTSKTDDYNLVTQNTFENGASVQITLSNGEVLAPSFESLRTVLVNKALECNLNLTANSQDAHFGMNSLLCTSTWSRATNFVFNSDYNSGEWILNLTVPLAAENSSAAFTSGGSLSLENVQISRFSVRSLQGILEYNTSGTIDTFDFEADLDDGGEFEQRGIFTSTLKRETEAVTVHLISFPVQDTEGYTVVRTNNVTLMGASNYSLSTSFQYLGSLDCIGQGSDMNFELSIAPATAVFTGAGKVQIEAAFLNEAYDIYDFPDKTRAQSYMTRNITVTDFGLNAYNGEIDPSLWVNCSDGTALETLSIIIHDGENYVLIESESVYPQVDLRSGILATSISASTNVPLQIENKPLLDAASRTIQVDTSSEKENSCMELTYVCTEAAWLEHAIFDAPCTSEFLRDLGCGTPNSSIALRFPGAFQCRTEAFQVGWTITTGVEPVSPVEIEWVRQLLIIVMSLNFFVLISSWVLFGCVLIEGWTAFALTAVLGRMPYDPYRNFVALSITKKANYLFNVWFYNDICEEVSEYPTWGFIFMTFMIVIVLALYQHTSPSVGKPKQVKPSGYFLCSFDTNILLRGGTDLVKRLSIAFSLFWLLPPVISHLQFEKENSIYVSTVVIVGILLVFGAYAFDSFLVPGWIHRNPPGKLGFAVWSQKVHNYCVLGFMLSILIIPPCLVHFDVFDTAYWHAAVIVLIFAFCVFTMLKEWALRPETISPLYKKLSLFTLVTTIINLAFGIAFAASYKSSDGAVAFLWIVWALFLPLCYIGREVARFHFYQVPSLQGFDAELQEIEGAETTV